MKVALKIYKPTKALHTPLIEVRIGWRENP
jgi:hypothetical protein